MWKRLNSNQMCEKCSYKEVFLISRFLIERFYCIYIYIYIPFQKNISLDFSTYKSYFNLKIVQNINNIYIYLNLINKKYKIRKTQKLEYF